jgi:O-antigen ligase
MPTDRIGVEMTRPRPRRLPLEQVIATTAWMLVVLNVQPWVKPSFNPQGQVTVESSSSKGVVMAGVFMVAVALAAPHFSARLPATYLFYLGYIFVATATAFQLSDPVGPLLRVGRLGLAIAIPILLWRWLAGRSHLFLGAQRTAHLLITLVVLAGIAAAPGSAWAGSASGSTWAGSASFAAGGRLQGVFLPMLPPRVGEIGAILVGLTATALAFRKLGNLVGAIFISLGLTLVILSRTRTAAVALLVALVVAFSLTRKYRLGRRALRTILLLMLLAIPLLAPIRSWVVRDQDARELSSFTGRTLAWSAVVEQQSSWRTVVLGHGLGNKEVLLRRGEGDIGVMAIDNGWLALFWETGLLGVGLVLSAFVAAVVGVVRAPTPYVRAATAFLVTYVAIASFTETGLSDLSSQTLHLLVASGAAYADRLLVRRERPMLATVTRSRPQSATFAGT